MSRDQLKVLDTESQRSKRRGGSALGQDDPPEAARGIPLTGRLCTANAEREFTKEALAIRVKRTHSSDWRKQSAEKAFGTLYEWLAQPHLKTPRGPLKEDLRRHIFETEPTAQGRKIFGEVDGPNRI